MPLYSYIPYLDPELKDRQDLSFFGNVEKDMEDTNFQDDNCWNCQIRKKQPFSIAKNPVESYKRKLNENFKNFEGTVNKFLEDGLGGVDSICKKVHDLVDDKQRLMGSCTVNCAKIDTFGCFKKLNFPDAPKDSLIEQNEITASNSFEYTSNAKKESPEIPKPVTVHPNENLDAAKESPCAKYTKGAEPRAVTPKEAVFRGADAAKERLRQIEKDYQKVLENLDMVETMMATVNERMRQQKNGVRQEAPKSEGEKAIKPVKIKRKKKKRNSEKLKNTPKREEIISEATKESEETEKVAQQQADKEETVEHEETTEKLETIKEKPNPRKRKRKQKTGLPTLPPVDVETGKNKELIKLIDNAVEELASHALLSGISRTSSDVSFATAIPDGASEFRERARLNGGGSSTSSGLDVRFTDKFETSKSFQELRNFYEQKERSKGERKRFARKKSMRRVEDKGNMTEVSLEGTDAKDTREVKEEILKCTEEIEKLMEQEREEWKTDETDRDDPSLAVNSERDTEENDSSRHFENLFDTSVALDEEVSRYFFQHDESSEKGRSDDDTISKTQTNDEQDSLLTDDLTIQNVDELSECTESLEEDEENNQRNLPGSQQHLETGDECADLPAKTNDAQPTEESMANFEEIKKFKSNFEMYSSQSSSIETITAAEKTKEETPTPVDPMRQVSIQCRKLLGDLLEDQEETKTPEEVAADKSETPEKEFELKTPSEVIEKEQADSGYPEIVSLTPEVHRKKAEADLHERMECQIRQTDSFDGFLHLMDKNRREQVIRQAERQDRWKYFTKNPLQVKHPFKVVVPPSFDSKSKYYRKDSDKKLINSLWFSPKDFKLRRSSRILNKKKMETFCQSLHKSSTSASRKQSGDVASKAKCSNYSILMRSCSPIGRRPYTPRRWLDPGQRTRIRHCDILEDLTLKDLAPFNAEYPREDEKHLREGVRGSFLYKLACGEHKGDADGTLMELISPRLCCADTDCETCKGKKKSQKKSSRRPRKTDDNSLRASTRTNLTPKAATQLLMQNIGEIKSKKNSQQIGDNCQNKRRNPPRQQKKDDGTVKVIKLNQQYVPAENKPSRKGIEQMQKVLKIAELYPVPPNSTSDLHKLFPYINNPDNRVFQNITVLPVMVQYNAFEDQKFSRAHTPVNVTFTSETEEMEVSKGWRPKTGENDCYRRRSGTPKTPTGDLRKFDNVPKSLENFMKNKDAACGNTKKCREHARRQRCKRTRSLGKTAECENTGARSKHSVNPNPWKPASRRPSTPKAQPFQKPPKQMFSQRPWFPKLKTQEKPSVDVPHREPPNRPQPPLSRERKPTRIMSSYDTGAEGMRQQEPSRKTSKSNALRVPTPSPPAQPQKYRPNSPNHKVMMDHFYMLRNKNTKLEGNIQKSICVIEEKILDVLSTNDQSHKRKTIDRMEREINKVLRMINEQNCAVVKKEEIESKNDVQTKEESAELKASSDGPKMPRPPKKRSISRVLKFRSGQDSFQERGPAELFQIKEIVASEEEEREISKELEVVAKEETGDQHKHIELYPSVKIGEEEHPHCPVLRCPTPGESLVKLNEKTKEVMKKISKEAFGRFADVLKTKTKLILDMTDRIDINDVSLLPSPQVASSIQAILARSKLPVLDTKTQDLMATTVIPLVEKQKPTLEKVLNAVAEKTSESKMQLSVSSAPRDITGYTWGRFGRPKPILQSSTCSLRRNSYHDLTPFVRALNTMKTSRFFEKRHNLLPIEGNQTNFENFVTFLEGFTKVRDTFKQITIKEQPVWKPERSSLHGSLSTFEDKRKTDDILECSMIQLEEKPSEINVAIEDSKIENLELENDKKEDIKTEEIEKGESEVQTEENTYKKINLMLSEVHLLTISSAKNPITKMKKKNFDPITSMEFVSKSNSDRYSSILKFFYLFFYTSVYLCMNAMNFSC